MLLLPACSELDLSNELINPDEPEPIYDLYAIAVSDLLCV